jgi:hypothetical protein
MTYLNRPRQLLRDFASIGIGIGIVISAISSTIAGRGGSDQEVAAAAAWLGFGQVLFGFGLLCLVGYMVARSVAYDIRHAHLPEDGSTHESQPQTLESD